MHSPIVSGSAAEPDPRPDPERTTWEAPDLGDSAHTISHDDALTSFTLTPSAGELPDTGGRYRLEAEIARGAMGRVFRATDAAFGRDVAVKVLLDEHLGRPDPRQRFAEEARVTALLQHPGIVPVYEAGEFPGGRPFFTMRLVRGVTLATVLEVRPNHRADRSQLLKGFEKLCETLAYAHGVGVIHRDLKPANVMIGEFGRVKLMDWGVAKVLPNSPFIDPGPAPPPRAGEAGPEPGEESEALTQMGRVLGSPAYMSPEQARGQVDRIDERTDVFGLGAILCVILTGQPPYPGADARSVYRLATRAALTDAFARLGECGARPELVALARRCLAADPADRPRDAGVLYAELAECLDHDRGQAERDLARFFDLSPDLFCIAGTNGYFHRVNANFTRVLGYTAEELLARPFVEFVHPADRDRTTEEVRRLAAGGTCTRFMNRYRDVDGGYRWFEWTAKAAPGEGVIFAVARDQTDRVRLEARLRAFERR